MPVVDIQFVLPAGRDLPEGTAAALAQALGQAMSAAPGTLWLRLHTLPASRYAENGPAAEDAELPVFVTMLQARPATGPALQAEATAVAQAVARTIGLPRTKVHIEYAPPGAGRVAFGGQLVH